MKTVRLFRPVWFAWIPAAALFFIIAPRLLEFLGRYRLPKVIDVPVSILVALLCSYYLALLVGGRTSEFQEADRIITVSPRYFLIRRHANEYAFDQVRLIRDRKSQSGHRIRLELFDGQRIDLGYGSRNESVRLREMWGERWMDDKQKTG